MPAPSSSVPRRSLSDLLVGVEALRAVAIEHAAESERLRTLAPAVVDGLRASGLLGVATPEAVGGDECAMRSQLEVFEAMARIDTSTGWALMISSMLSGLAGAYLPEQGAREVFAAGIPTCAGLLMPGGTLRSVAGGYRASGRWGFGSGIRHADWLVTSAVLADRPVSPAGLPEMLSIVVPAREATIEDTWYAAGLRGSGSEHYRMEDVFVPEHRTFVFPRAPALRGGPMYDLPLIAILSAAHAGFALGAARAALDEITRVAPGRIRGWSQVALGAHPGFHMNLGRAHAKLRAARALCCEVMDALGQRMQDGLALSAADWSDARLCVSWTTEIAAEVSQFAFRAGGSSALYDSSPLQRSFRDLHAAAQHIAATDDAYEYAGRVLLGIAEPNPLMEPRLSRTEASSSPQ